MNFVDRKEPPDFSDECWQLGGEIGIAFCGHHEAEDFLSDQVVQGALQSESFTDGFRRCTLFDPDLMGFYGGPLMVESFLPGCGAPKCVQFPSGGQSRLC